MRIFKRVDVFLILIVMGASILNSCQKDEAAIDNVSAKFEKVVTKTRLKTTLNTVTDIDGNVYNTVTIGTQTWMKENLKTTKYRNGDPIPNVTGNSEWESLTTGAYCWLYNDIYSPCGVLYNFYAVSDIRNIAPIGWHVPSADEWTTLINYLGGVSVAGSKMKQAGTQMWSTPNTGTNESGFTSLPGGLRNGGYPAYSAFDGMWRNSGYWSTTNGNYLVQGLYYSSSRVERGSTSLQSGWSVRCIRDYQPLSIGSTYQGGIIAYFLQPGDPGYDANVEHGIIVAPSDLGTSINWYNGSYVITGASGTLLGTGNANTSSIVNAQGAGSYAAKLCSDLVLGGYDDWYLPSKEELNKLYLNKLTIGGFTTAPYWSSSEISANSAWVQMFNNGSYINYFTKNYTIFVRAVRSF